MRKVEKYVEQLYQRRQLQELDVVLPIIGDEGVGKSTLMLQVAIKYLQARDGEVSDPSAILDRIYFTRDDWKTAMSESEKRSLIIIPDAARVLFSKDAMVGDQKEIEKDLMDVRGMEFFILLGFQDFDTIPKQVKTRRAKNCLYIPKRGLVRGYNREGIDKRLEDESWPPASMKDSFPALDGTELWAEYQKLDQEEKRERISDGVEPDPEDVAKKTQLETVLRAVKPWDERTGMSQSDAATLIEYSESWVSRNIRDWKKGEKWSDVFEDRREECKPEEVSIA